jgi:hypothetical protein
MPEKVSVIPATVLDDCDARDVIDYLKGSVTPDHDPETGEVHEIPATEPVMTASRQSTQPASPGRPGDAGSDSPIPAAQPGHADVRPKSPSTSAPPAPPSPAANRKEAEPVRALTSVKDWHDYCFTWLKAMDDDPVRNDVDVLTKWNGETKLRNSCGVTADDRQQLFAFMTAIVEKKREAQKAI